MLWKNISVLAAILATTSATNIPPPKPANVVRDITPRQTDSTLSQLLDFANKLGLTACLPRALPLASELPAIPPGFLNNDLFSQALSQTTLAVTDLCKFSITGTNGPVFTSFLPTVYSWYDEHSSQIASIVSACPSASGLVQTVESYGSCPQVATLSVGATASETGTASTTDSETFSIETDTVISTSASEATSASSTKAASTTSSASLSTSASQAQAPRETGFAVAAVAVAGFLGVVAAL